VQDPELSAEQRQVLTIMERTFKCYITEDPAAKVWCDHRDNDAGMIPPALPRSVMWVVIWWLAAGCVWLLCMP
jgi:hypothetical protein